MSHCCHHACHQNPGQVQSQSRPRRRGGIIRMLVEVLFLYAVLVFGGGTLIQTGHPVAVEAGRLIHTVTFVEPTIGWARSRGMDVVANGVRYLSAGVDVGGMIGT